MSTRMNSQKKKKFTLINQICYNNIFEVNCSGKLLCLISDYLLCNLKFTNRQKLHQYYKDYSAYKEDDFIAESNNEIVGQKQDVDTMLSTIPSTLFLKNTYL